MRPLAILLIVSTSLCADDDPTTKAQIAATVNNQPISVRLAEYELQRSLRGRKVAPHLMKALKAETLRKLVMREVVLQHLEKSGLRVNDQQVNEAVLQWKTQLEQDGKTVQQTLKEMDVAPNDVKRGFRWQLMWVLSGPTS